MDEQIAFIYDPDKNPDKTWVDGVPLRDLSKAEFDALPKRLQAAVKQQPYYVPAGKRKAAGKEE